MVIKQVCVFVVVYVCVCVCARARARACVRACVRVFAELLNIVVDDAAAYKRPTVHSHCTTQQVALNALS